MFVPVASVDSDDRIGKNWFRVTIDLVLEHCTCSLEGILEGGNWIRWELD
jgi:hypothetical protein